MFVPTVYLAISSKRYSRPSLFTDSVFAGLQICKNLFVFPNQCVGYFLSYLWSHTEQGECWVTREACSLLRWISQCSAFFCGSKLHTLNLLVDTHTHTRKHTHHTCNTHATWNSLNVCLCVFWRFFIIFNILEWTMLLMHLFHNHKWFKVSSFCIHSVFDVHTLFKNGFNSWTFEIQYSQI
jgi:hypothetical protein